MVVPSGISTECLGVARAESCPPQNLEVEAVSPSVAESGGKVFRRWLRLNAVIRVGP